MAITDKQAEKVRVDICKRYAVDPDDPSGPKVIRNWDWPEYTVIDVAIVWEGGDFDWAHRVSDGGFNEEIYGAAIEFVGKGRARKVAMEKALKLAKGLRVGPVTGWSVSLYKD